MKLWIRSQDRESITEITNIQYTSANGNHYIGTYYDNLKILGEYATKSRALEVLDEIQKFISQEEFLHIRKSSLNNLDEISEPKYILQSCGLPKVYEMPEE